MKKVLLSAATFAIMFASCGSTNGAATGAPAQTSTIDKVAQIASTISQISGILGANTNLTSDQSSSLLATVTKYVSNYNSISSLATTDKAAFSTKLSGYASQAVGEVKQTVSDNQYAQILTNLAAYKKEQKAEPTAASDTMATLLSSLLQAK